MKLVNAKYSKAKSMYGTLTTEELSVDELLQCAREVLGGDNEKHKDDIYQYLDDNRERLITEESITEFLCLLNICRSKRLIRALIPSAVIRGNLFLWNIIENANWRRVDYEAMVAFLEEIGRWWLVSLPIAMRWLLEKQGYMEDPCNKASVTRLLSLVCLKEMPSNYRDTVLFPYLKNTFLSRDVQLTNVGKGNEYYRCSWHDHEKCTGMRNPVVKCTVTALPAGFSFMQEDAKLAIPGDLGYHYELALKIYQDPCLTLSLVLSSTGEVCCKDCWFILFDKDNCMDRYPVRRVSYDIDELTNLLAKYKNLRIAIL